MKAIIIEQYGGPEKLVIHNHAETHMRRGEWAEAAKVSGIECVGVVKACLGGEFMVAQKVAAFMGGMGRTINGSYAEYTSVALSNVVAIESALSWEELAAIPESYATAWTCLHRNLERGQVCAHR
jgi:NADPH:quinone reductase-like Zn-dependent oxidoreductase